MVAKVRLRPRVLIVDDDIPTVTALKRLLKPAFDCEGCGDGDSARSLLKGGPYALAMLDITIPPNDGWALLDYIRHKMPSLPVVMLSGDARPDTIISAMRRGACDFVVKPFENPKELTARLQNAATQGLGPNTIAELLVVLEDEKKPLPRYSEARQTVLAEFTRAYLERLMRESGGNLSAASRLSGIDRANLRRALQKYKRN